MLVDGSPTPILKGDGLTVKQWLNVVAAEVTYLAHTLIVNRAVSPLLTVTKALVVDTQEEVFKVKRVRDSLNNPALW
jgi:hypothetical protein